MKELKKSRNKFDFTPISKDYWCYECFQGRCFSNEVKSINLTGYDYYELNDAVKLVQPAYKSLAIQVGGNAPFVNNHFDSTRPLIHLAEYKASIHQYDYCPNVTDGMVKYRKWSLTNIWSDVKSRFLRPITFSNCPHTLYNQTIIIGTIGGVPSWEGRYYKTLAKYFSINNIEVYCTNGYSDNLADPTPDFYEWMAKIGMVHFAGYSEQMKEYVPFHFTSSTYSWSYFIGSRHPVNLPPWTNLTNIFAPTVWLITFLCLLLMSVCFLSFYKVYKTLFSNEDMILISESIGFGDFFIKTFASITEPDPISWFKSNANAGRVLILTWALSSLFLNFAFNCNLRAVLLRPTTEKPINSLQDAFDRGQNIWVQHLVINWANENVISQYYLDHRLNPSVKSYIESRGEITSYRSFIHNSILMDDVMSNGASIVYEDFSYYDLSTLLNDRTFITKSKENVVKNLLHQ